MIGIFCLEGLDLSELEGIITEYDNPFSRTMLEDALEGFYAEPVLALLRYFSRGDSPPEAVSAVQAMGSISGKDTVAGMLHGLYLSGPATAVPGKITYPAPSCGNKTVHGGIRS